IAARGRRRGERLDPAGRRVAGSAARADVRSDGAVPGFDAVSWLDRLLSGWKESDDAPPRGDPTQVLAVGEILEEMRPMFAADGGEVRLVAVEDGWVVLQLRGACDGCNASDLSIH